MKVKVVPLEPGGTSLCIVSSAVLRAVAQSSATSRVVLKTGLLSLPLRDQVAKEGDVSFNKQGPQLPFSALTPVPTRPVLILPTIQSPWKNRQRPLPLSLLSLFSIW
jgi:hypothetical protein